MAEPLKHLIGSDAVAWIGASIRDAWPGFDEAGFNARATSGLEALELKARAAHVADAMWEGLPRPWPRAAEVLVASLGPEIEGSEVFGLSVLRYLPHVTLVARYGLDDFEASMAAQEALTRRFSCEFSIRGFLVRYPERTLARLHDWAAHPNVHVRRLVSEGTRPRLPWAEQLPAFRADPTPTLALLDRLVDDPELYVRRSVANHLGDIAKDHPDRAVAVAARWLAERPERRWVVDHGLRALVKAGHPGALGVVGFAARPAVEVVEVVLPREVRLGGELAASFVIAGTGSGAQDLLVDLVVWFVKADGGARPKVFKLKKVRVEAGRRVPLTARVSFAPMSTRTSRPGTHQVALRINGVDHPVGAFEVLP